MSVENLLPGAPFRENWLQTRILDPIDACSICGEPVGRVGVVWQCIGALLVLHPPCAYDLAHDLIGDARSAIRLIEGKPLRVGVNVEPGALER